MYWTISCGVINFSASASGISKPEHVRKHCISLENTHPYGLHIYNLWVQASDSMKPTRTMHTFKECTNTKQWSKCATRENNEIINNCKCKYKPNSSSIAMMISTWSKLSNPKSFMKWDVAWSYKDLIIKQLICRVLEANLKYFRLICFHVIKLMVYLPSQGWSCHRASGRRGHGHG